MELSALILEAEVEADERSRMVSGGYGVATGSSERQYLTTTYHTHHTCHYKTHITGQQR